MRGLDAPETTSERASHRRAIALWLYAVAALVIVMIVVGGATRLTDSGLSIVEWRPVTGAIPPLSENDWIVEFGKYQTSSEYQIVNQGMTLDQFKQIYWWEWIHRLLGRIIGLAFLLPFLFFLWRGWIGKQLGSRLGIIFAVGALQAAIGWWMVASGLVGRVDVAHERLAIHLTMACLILSAIVATARGIDRISRPGPLSRRLVLEGGAILAVLFVQIALGGLVAGLKAGLVYDTWPLIDGAFIPAPEKLLFLDPAWMNILDNHLTVQFMHRMTAYLLVGLVLLHALDCIRCGTHEARLRATLLAAIIIGQATIGIITLLWHVPLNLALIHQGTAVLALVVATVHFSDLRATSLSPAGRVPRPKPLDAVHAGVTTNPILIVQQTRGSIP
jgi:cytochrome c oxidase assembly protein subunit 15